MKALPVWGISGTGRLAADDILIKRVPELATLQTTITSGPHRGGRLGRPDQTGVLVDRRLAHLRHRSSRVQRRPVGPGSAVWILAVGVSTVVLAVAGLTYLHRAHSPDSSWPRLIVVNGRRYVGPTTASAAEVGASDTGWLQIGTAGPAGSPVYGAVVPGAAPTVVVVQTALNAHVEYVLVGGP